MREISKTLKIYERWSEQKVSSSKSSITFSKHIVSTRRRRLLRILGFVKGKLSFKYLGVPILASQLKAVHLDDIVGRIKDRMEGWKNKLLLNGSRVLLLCQVLMSILIHLLSTVHAPISVVKKINRSQVIFFRCEGW